jgi:large subunit ribosomal protein L31
MRAGLAESETAPPFWTGAHRVLDTAGRVEKFERKYGRPARPGAARATGSEGEAR